MLYFRPDTMKLARLFAAEVGTQDLPNIVPFEASSGLVGPGYIQRLAADLKGDYQRDPDNIGLMDDFSVLQGRWLDPTRVHSLIKEFYQHTSRFTVVVRPQWHWLARPVFWLLRKIFLELVGQFNLPIDDAEAGRGLESHIDVIDYNHDKVIDLRGWVRTYAGSEVVVYVGIYTTKQLSDGAYVSVGFPLPDANLTATLVPMNSGKHDFVLKSSKWGSRYAGDYIARIDESVSPPRISAFRIRGLSEEIEVYVKGDQLLTDHRFSFIGFKFLTLLYSLIPKSAPAPQVDVGDLMANAPAVRKSSPVRLAEPPARPQV
jgi:hypothetical protein